MKANIFRIISTSWALAIPSSLLLIFSGIFLSYYLFRGNEIVYWAFCIFFVILSFWLQRFISRGEVIICLTQDFVTIEWKRQYIFHKRPDRKIKFDEIKSYKFQEDRNFDLFRITLTDDTEINFWHHTFTKDDFKILVYAFPDFIKQHNKRMEAAIAMEQPAVKPQKIEREKTIFEDAASPFLAFLAIFIIIAILAIMILKPGKSSGYFGGFAVLAGASFYLAKYWKYRKKKTTDKD